ncbi:hypothetical protein R3P38DRAFT_2960500, partial [Favolaschia claudopus]
NELLQRIEELSLTIAQQKEILRNLETSRSDARMALNAVSDPVARLPVEVASNVFTLCLPDDQGYPQPDPQTAPLLLLRISRLWRDIMLSSPSLWATVHFDLRAQDSSEYAPGVAAWLGRTRDAPLNLHLSGSISDPITTVIEQHAPQMQTLKLRTWFNEGQLLEYMAPFASLRVLKLFGTRGITISECLQYLDSAPRLDELGIGSDYLPMGDPIPVLHTSLRTLQLWEESDCCPSLILKYLTLPALEHLVISQSCGADGNVSGFLARSSPPRLRIHIGGERKLQHLGLVPGLSAITVQCTHFEP